jgi:hypothetical protein
VLEPSERSRLHPCVRPHAVRSTAVGTVTHVRQCELHAFHLFLFEVFGQAYDSVACYGLFAAKRVSFSSLVFSS